MQPWSGFDGKSERWKPDCHFYSQVNPIIDWSCLSYVLFCIYLFVGYTYIDYHVHVINSPRGVRFDSISAVEEEISMEVQHVGNLEQLNWFDQDKPPWQNLPDQFDQLEEDWVPLELKQLLQNDLQVENHQDVKPFEVRSENLDYPGCTDKQRHKQNITINIDLDALEKRVKALRAPHKGLYKKILKRNHKLQLKAIRKLRKRKRKRCKEWRGGMERKNA